VSSDIGDKLWQAFYTNDKLLLVSFDTNYYPLSRIFIDFMTPAINLSAVSATPAIISGR
jgi:hypothetical protein